MAVLTVNIAPEGVLWAVQYYSIQASYSLNRTRVCYRVKCKTRVLACNHTLLHAFPLVAILLLQTYGHYPSTTCFHILSFAHLSIPNDAENIRIINLSHAPRIMAHLGIPGSFLNTNQSQ